MHDKIRMSQKNLQNKSEKSSEELIENGKLLLEIQDYKKRAELILRDNFAICYENQKIKDELEVKQNY